MLQVAAVVVHGMYLMALKVELVVLEAVDVDQWVHQDQAPHLLLSLVLQDS
tara:strand:- start:156 stop:308 length:153 start_codon:yes stop_codon:yes gene_type:complete